MGAHPDTGDERGSVTVLFALAITVLFAAAAIGVDLAAIWTEKRRAQAAADLAAMIAAANPAQAERAALRSLRDNGYGPAGQDVSVRLGSYVSTAERATASRFTPDDRPANAVRVAFRSSVATRFARIVGLPERYGISATGTAATAQFASFTIGSRLASLNGGVANAVLGGLLGTRVSLSVMDYDALASANVDALVFLDGLATRAGLTAASYDALLASNVSLGQIAPALAASLPGGTAAQIVDDLGRRLANPSALVPVSALLPQGDVPPGRRGGSGGLRLDALGTLLDAVAIANGRRQVAVDLGPSLPGLLRTRIVASVGQRKQSSGMVQVGSARGTLRTGQTRLLLEATVSLGIGTVTLPVYVEAAFATGTLSGMSCPAAGGGRTVTVDVKPGVVDVAIASVPTSAVDLDQPPPALTGEATLLSLPLLTVRGRARASWSAAYAKPLLFNESDILTRQVRSVSSTGPVSSITGDLLANLKLTVNGIDPLSAITLERSLQATLSALAPTLDEAIDTTLRLLGVRLGTAEVSVDGTRCEGAVLVQ